MSVSKALLLEAEGSLPLLGTGGLLRSPPPVTAPQLSESLPGVPGKSTGRAVQSWTNGVQIPVLSLVVRMILTRLLNPSVPRVPPLTMG